MLSNIAMLICPKVVCFKLTMHLYITAWLLVLKGSIYMYLRICVYTLYMYAILKVHVSLVSLFSIHFLIGQAGGRRCGTQASYSGNLSSL